MDENGICKNAAANGMAVRIPKTKSPAPKYPAKPVKVALPVLHTTPQNEPKILARVIK